MWLLLCLKLSPLVEIDLQWCYGKSNLCTLSPRASFSCLHLDFPDTIVVNTIKFVDITHVVSMFFWRHLFYCMAVQISNTAVVSLITFDLCYPWVTSKFWCESYATSNVALSTSEGKFCLKCFSNNQRPTSIWQFWRKQLSITVLDTCCHWQAFPSTISLSLTFVLLTSIFFNCIIVLDICVTDKYSNCTFLRHVDFYVKLDNLQIEKPRFDTMLKNYSSPSLNW